MVRQAVCVLWGQQETSHTLCCLMHGGVRSAFHHIIDHYLSLTRLNRPFQKGRRVLLLMSPVITQTLNYGATPSMFKNLARRLCHELLSFTIALKWWLGWIFEPRARTGILIPVVDSGSLITWTLYAIESHNRVVLWMLWGGHEPWDERRWLHFSLNMVIIRLDLTRLNVLILTRRRRGWLHFLLLIF